VYVESFVHHRAHHNHDDGADHKSDDEPSRHIAIVQLQIIRKSYAQSSTGEDRSVYSTGDAQSSTRRWDKGNTMEEFSDSKARWMSE
jgi:hypothetical protein